MTTPKVKDINEVLTKFQTMTPEDSEWDFYFEIILNQYKRLIHKAIKPQVNHDDYFQEIILELPNIISKWDQSLSSFPTYLYRRITGIVQILREKENIVSFSERINKQSANSIKTKRYTQQKRESLKKQRLERTLKIFNLSHNNYDVSKEKTSFINERGRPVNFPSTRATAEDDAIFSNYIDKIKHVRDFKLWYDSYINEKSTSEICEEYVIQTHVFYNRIEKAHHTICAILKRIIEKPTFFSKTKKGKYPQELRDEIKNRYEMGDVTQRELSQIYGIGENGVWRILNNRG